jgi:hypothetical protein
MRSRFLQAACAGLVFSLAGLAQVSVFPTGDPPATSPQADPPQADPSQLAVISGADARSSLGASVSFGDGGDPGASGAAGFGNPGKQASASLPMWTYTVKAAQDGRTYSGKIVGASPSSTTPASVPVTLVPVVFKITQGGHAYTFDPTQADAGCLGSGNAAFALTQHSPLFSSTSFAINGQNINNTTYGDAFLQAEFWNLTGSSRKSLLALGPPAIGATLTISVNAGTRGNSTATVYAVSGQCGNGLLAVVNINTVDAALQSYIFSHGLNAAQFPFFVTYNAVMSVGSASNLNNCCVLGYHNALGNPGQTYGIAEFEGRDQTLFGGVADVAAASHEVNEWINDPSGANPTPAWGNVGQVSGCQNNFEVGDPLSGTLMPTVTQGGFTYHLQELAFYSWFYGGTSLGTGGKYSSNGTFKGSAKLCPPGGTN